MLVWWLAWPSRRSWASIHTWDLNLPRIWYHPIFVYHASPLGAACSHLQALLHSLHNHNQDLISFSIFLCESNKWYNKTLYISIIYLTKQLFTSRDKCHLTNFFSQLSTRFNERCLLTSDLVQKNNSFNFGAIIQ